MKVIVRCANNRITKADMEREIERLFQENKDLRVYVGHLCDELSLAQQQSEARRQVICERDKLIQELNDQIAADEEELAKSERESSQGMNAVVKFWEEAVREKNKAEERAEEYRIALMESDCRVDECEKRMDWLSKEVLEWKAAAEGYKNQYEELKAQKEADDKKSEEICAACNERYEDVLSDRNRLRDRVAKYEKSVTFAKLEEATLTTSHLREEVEILTNERNTAVDENTQLTFELTELKDKYEAERALRWNAENQVQYWRNEAQQKESNLRAAIEEREHWSDKAAQLSDEVNFYKSGRDASKKELEELGKEVERLRGVEETVETYRMARDVERQRRIETEENYQSLHEEYERVRDAADDYRKKCQEIKQDRFDAIAQLIMKAIAADDTASKVLGFSEESK